MRHVNSRDSVSKTNVSDRFLLYKTQFKNWNQHIWIWRYWEVFGGSAFSNVDVLNEASEWDCAAAAQADPCSRRPASVMWVNSVFDLNNKRLFSRNVLQNGFVYLLCSWNLIRLLLHDLSVERQSYDSCTCFPMFSNKRNAAFTGVTDSCLLSFIFYAKHLQANERFFFFSWHL